MAKPKARGHGEGTVFRLDTGQWAAEITLPPGPDGKRKRRRRIRATRAAALLALAELKRGLAEDGPLDRASTVAQFLERWLRDDVPRMRPASVRSYASIVRRNIVPHLGHVPLCDLDAARIEAWQAAERAVKPPLKPPAASTQRLRLRVLRAALSTAKRRKLVRENEAALAVGPSAPPKEPPRLSLAAARAIERAVAGDRLEPLFLLALYMGLRHGEALGLRWRHVDVERRTLAVEQQLQRRRGGWDELPPKSRSGARELTIPAPVAESLRRHRARQAADRLRAEAWPWGDLVFTHPDGRPLHQPRNSTRLYALLAAAGLERRTFHQLRHGAASLLHATGTPMKDIQAILGHASLAITADLYTHVFRESLQAASDRLDAALRGVSEG